LQEGQELSCPDQSIDDRVSIRKVCIDWDDLFGLNCRLASQCFGVFGGNQHCELLVQQPLVEFGTLCLQVDREFYITDSFADCVHQSLRPDDRHHRIVSAVKESRRHVHQILCIRKRASARNWDKSGDSIRILNRRMQQKNSSFNGPGPATSCFGFIHPGSVQLLTVFRSENATFGAATHFLRGGPSRALRRAYGVFPSTSSWEPLHCCTC